MSTARIPLWPAGVGGGLEGQEMYLGPDLAVRNVTVPTIEVFAPVSEANGTAVIIAPGGAFHLLMVGYEGSDFADWLSARGLTAFLLRYRLRATPRSDSAMTEHHRQLVEALLRTGSEPNFVARLDPAARAVVPDSVADAGQAIRLVRERAGEWGIDPHRVGISGFSAGGTVALAAAISGDPSARPDFAAPIYPGADVPVQVPANAPPLFLAASQDDLIIPASSCVAVWSAWRAAGSDAELHLFRSGGHGFGMKRRGLASDGWTDALERWMDDLGLLGAAGRVREDVR